MAKPSWPDYFLRLAYLASTRASCPRKHVGCVIVNDYRRVIATGYNGAPAGAPSCDEVGCDIVDDHCVRSIHSEQNAINDAGRLARDCTIYCVCIPCWDCAKSIVNVGIKRVIFDEAYSSRYGKSSAVPAFFAAAGVELIQHDTPMLAAYKKKMEELQALEASVLSTMLVEYACGCSAPATHAAPTCSRHGQRRVHE